MSINFFPINLIFLPSLVNIAMAFIILALFYIFNRQFTASAIYSSIFIVWFYNYGAVNRALNALSWGQLILERKELLFALWLLFLFILWFISHIIIKNGKQAFLNYFLNIVAVALVIMPLLFCFYGFLSQIKANIRANKFLAKEMHSYKLPGVKKAVDRPSPDIYFIILDAYTNKRSLRTNYGYDNSAFLNDLRRRSFYVAEKATSNYPISMLSLTATLNMRYLDEMPLLFGRYSQNVSLIMDLWKNNNKVESLFRSMGYEIINLNYTGYETKRSILSRQGVFARLFSADFDRLLIKKTIILPWYRQIEERTFRGLTISAFSELRQNKNKSKPRFIYTHIPCPHGPYVFGPDGEETGSDYIKQVKFINKKILATIDQIRVQSQIPPIMIIQGDHGSYYNINIFSNELPSDRNIGPQFGVLNAMYLPGKDTSFLPDNLSSVNTFRIIMDLYFSGHYLLLKNKHYYATYAMPFDFHDVTNVVERFNSSASQGTSK
ncbi:MAG: hypothetical protein ABIH50_02735 [bacterium]